MGGLGAERKLIARNRNIAARKKDGRYYPHVNARKRAMRLAVAERCRLEREEQQAHIGLRGRRLEEDEALKFFADLPTVQDLFKKYSD